MMAEQTFTLSEATLADVPGMIQVYKNAFSSDYFGQLVFPPDKIGDEELHRWLTARFTALFHQPEVRAFVMTEDGTGTVAAFLRWTFPHVLTEEEQEKRKREKEEKQKVRAETGYDPSWPKGSNLELCDEKFGGLNKLQEKYVDRKEMYIANLLGTDPAYQRKGLASRLLKHVLDIADREGRKVYIEATPKGYPVYLKLGFKDVDIIAVDLTKWGGKEIGTNRILIRDPNPVF